MGKIRTVRSKLEKYLASKWAIEKKFVGLRVYYRVCGKRARLATKLEEQVENTPLAAREGEIAPIEAVRSTLS
jgi:uncharacterized membrane protein YebE (DUF533 family)